MIDEPTDAEGLTPSDDDQQTPHEEPLSDRVGRVAAAMPGLVRVVGSAAWHTTVWGAHTYVRTGTRMAKAIVDDDERSALARDAADALDTLSDLTRSVVGGERTVPHHPSTPVPPEDTPEALRRRGAELLDRSRDVWASEAGHPAYRRILDELAPDEARILLLLIQGGPQPSVDVRSGPVGLGGQLIARSLTMVGVLSGVRYPDRIPAYLNNLYRLGLIWFSKDSLRDPLDYQVLEAQPDVLAALHSAKLARVVRRSIHLTPFGEGFARMCLVDAPAEDFPEHASPQPDSEAEPPTP